MSSDLCIVAISDDLDAHAGWLEASETLHRQLRPDLPTDYADYMRRMCAEGAEMAVLVDAGVVRAVAVFRCHLTTFHGRRFYIDDLVADQAQRSRGFGGKLLNWCEALARQRGCGGLALESGVQRQRAHNFYFRQGMTIITFGFFKPLD